MQSLNTICLIYSNHFILLSVFLTPKHEESIENVNWKFFSYIKYQWNVCRKVIFCVLSWHYFIYHALWLLSNRIMWIIFQNIPWSVSENTNKLLSWNISFLDSKTLRDMLYKIVFFSTNWKCSSKVSVKIIMVALLKIIV